MNVTDSMSPALLNSFVYLVLSSSSYIGLPADLWLSLFIVYIVGFLDILVPSLYGMLCSDLNDSHIKLCFL